MIRFTHAIYDHVGVFILPLPGKLFASQLVGTSPTTRLILADFAFDFRHAHLSCILVCSC